MSETKEATPAASPQRTWDVGEWSAIFVGVCALAVSLYTANLQKTQTRAQVYPHVSLGMNLEESKFAYLVANDGVGPAIVKQMRVTVDGSPLRTWKEVFEKAAPALFQDGGVRQNVSTLEVLRPSGEIQMVAMEGLSSEQTAYLIPNLGRMELSLCYCSVLNECWTVVSQDKQGPTPVSSCHSSDVPFVGLDLKSFRVEDIPKHKPGASSAEDTRN
jgi:hypothetical protein